MSEHPSFPLSCPTNKDLADMDAARNAEIARIAPGSVTVHVIIAGDATIPLHVDKIMHVSKMEYERMLQSPKVVAAEMVEMDLPDEAIVDWINLRVERLG